MELPTRKFARFRQVCRNGVQSRENCKPRTSKENVRLSGVALARPRGSTKLKADFGTVMVARVDLTTHTFRDAARGFTWRHVRQERRKKMPRHAPEIFGSSQWQLVCRSKRVRSPRTGQIG